MRRGTFLERKVPHLQRTSIRIVERVAISGFKTVRTEPKPICYRVAVRFKAIDSNFDL